MASVNLATYRPPLPAEVNNTLTAWWLAILFGIAATVVFIPLFGAELQRFEQSKELDRVQELVQLENFEQTLWVVAGGLAGLILLMAVFIAVGFVCRSKIALLLFKASLVVGMLAGGAGIAGAAWFIYDHKLSLGAVPMLSAALLITIGIMPFLFGFLSLSLVHLRGVREFFNPPLEDRIGMAVGDVGRRYDEEGYAAAEQEAYLGEEYGEVPAVEAPFEEELAVADSDLIRAEFDPEADRDLIRAELDPEADRDLIRAELDPEADRDLIRAELDPEANAAKAAGGPPSTGIVRAEMDTGQRRAERQLEHILSDEDSVNEVIRAEPEPESQDVALAELHRTASGSKDDIDIGVEGLEPTTLEALPADSGPASGPQSGVVDIEGLLEAAKGGSQSGLSGVVHPEVPEETAELDEADEPPPSPPSPSSRRKRPAPSSTPSHEEEEDVLADVLGEEPEGRAAGPGDDREAEIADLREADTPKPAKPSDRGRKASPARDFLFEEEFEKKNRKKKGDGR